VIQSVIPSIAYIGPSQYNGLRTSIL